MKVAVFHPGTQHSWQTALALQQLGRLAWYQTSIFYKPDRFPYRLERLLPNPLRQSVHGELLRFAHADLDPDLVRTAGAAEWVERIFARLGMDGWARRMDSWGNRRFVRHMAPAIASSEPFALWGYNGSSRSSFELARKHGRVCILDRTTVDYRALPGIFAEIGEAFGDNLASLGNELPAAAIAADQREYELADRIVVGSPFAAETIRRATADPSIHAKLSVLEYCYDESLFGSLPPPRPVPADRPVRFLFLGLISSRKGAHHVLEAIARIPASAAELTLVGDVKISKDLLAPFADRVRFLPAIPRSEVPAVMAAHDVFLLPSYFEGAGITLYEALASGCALIQSNRCTPAVSAMTGINIGKPSTEAVYAAMMTAIENRDLLNAWRAAAQGEARKFTFSRYRTGISALLDGIGP